MTARDLESIRYAAALATREAESLAPPAHVDAVSMGRERALRNAAKAIRVLAYLNDGAGASGLPRKDPVHRARGIVGLATSCPQCKAAPGVPCDFGTVDRAASEETDRV